MIAMPGGPGRCATVQASSAEPSRITITPVAGENAGVAVEGIFRLDGDKLTVCVAGPGQPPPPDLTPGPDSGRTVYHLRALAPR